MDLAVDRSEITNAIEDQRRVVRSIRIRTDFMERTGVHPHPQITCGLREEGGELAVNGLGLGRTRAGAEIVDIFGQYGQVGTSVRGPAEQVTGNPKVLHPVVTGV